MKHRSKNNSKPANSTNLLLCAVNLWGDLINKPILRYYNSKGELVCDKSKNY
jgi:hypothetical protein